MQRTPGPLLFYGTSGKGRATERLTRFAIERGFRGIDSALHVRYAEAAVGAAVAGAIRDGIVRRGDLFLQTKFTPGLGMTVPQSFAASLERLQVDTIDSYILHAPDVAAWREMKSLPVRVLGVSNVTAAELDALGAVAKPAIVQNRCLAAKRWDAEVRAFCRAHGIAYQGFSLIVANPQVLASALVRRIAARVGRTPAQVVLRFARQLGIVPLVGTTKRRHMREALAVDAFELTEDDVARIERGR